VAASFWLTTIFFSAQSLLRIVILNLPYEIRRIIGVEDARFSANSGISDSLDKEVHPKAVEIIETQETAYQLFVLQCHSLLDLSLPLHVVETGEKVWVISILVSKVNSRKRIVSRMTLQVI
jgi:hypothetical protein